MRFTHASRKQPLLLPLADLGDDGTRSRRSRRSLGSLGRFRPRLASRSVASGSAFGHSSLPTTRSPGICRAAQHRLVLIRVAVEEDVGAALAERVVTSRNMQMRGQTDLAAAVCMIGGTCGGRFSSSPGLVAIRPIASHSQTSSAPTVWPWFRRLPAVPAARLPPLKKQKTWQRLRRHRHPLRSYVGDCRHYPDRRQRV